MTENPVEEAELYIPPELVSVEGETFPKFMQEMLGKLTFDAGPIPPNYGWQDVEITDQNGKKHAFAVLYLMTPNGLQVCWFNATVLHQFINVAARIAQVVVAKHQQLNPLLVASPADMQQVAKQQNNTSGIIIPPGAAR